MAKKNAKITIRCVGVKGQALNQVRFFTPYIAFNEIRMKQIGYIIQDPELEEKRKAVEYLDSESI